MFNLVLPIISLNVWPQNFPSAPSKNREKADKWLFQILLHFPVVAALILKQREGVPSVSQSQSSLKTNQTLHGVKVKVLLHRTLMGAGCLLCQVLIYVIVFNPLQKPLRGHLYFTDAEVVYPFSCDYRFCWQLFIKWGFQWRDLTLIYLHYPAISWVSVVHLTLYTSQGIKEMHHLLFFKCSWNDNFIFE